MHWTVPRLWPGATVAVLASGPSMSAAVADEVRRAGVPTIVVNNTFRLAPWAQMLYAADSEWWAYTRDARAFAGLKVSIDSGVRINGVHQLRLTGMTGFDPDPSALRTGGNSGYQAVHVAAHAGAARILLCGFDMRGGHWHPDHAQPLRTTLLETYQSWIQRFETLAALCPAQIVNCTPDSALRCVPYQPLEEALARAELAA